MDDFGPGVLVGFILTVLAFFALPVSDGVSAEQIKVATELCTQMDSEVVFIERFEYTDSRTFEFTCSNEVTGSVTLKE